MTSLEAISVDYVRSLSPSDVAMVRTRIQSLMPNCQPTIGPLEVIHADEAADRRKGVLVRAHVDVACEGTLDVMGLDAFVSFASGEPRLVDVVLDDEDHLAFG